ncbi:MAG: AmmeMemoRadiSam system protein B [Thiohalocapsa sp.]
MHIKPSVVAGIFYPQSQQALHAAVSGYLTDARIDAGAQPHALIAPHAGYVYSGPIAASAYAAARPWRKQIRRVAVLAPSHRVAFQGIATSNADAFQTPLGDVPVDRAAIETIESLPGVRLFDAAFVQEHALEVQLPFLQGLLDDFELVPLIVGDADSDDVAGVIEALLRDDTLIIVSSDLSHYLDYPSAQQRDRATTTHIEQLEPTRIGPQDACGAFPIRGLLQVARHHGWQVRTLDLRNSGDTAGDRSSVVGYGAYEFV